MNSANWTSAPLKRWASIRPSNVDKHSVESEQRIQLCNYVDVYKNDRITDSLELMQATASNTQIARFTLQAQDVIITKDSETPTDIGVPAYVPKDMPGVVCGYHLSLIRPDTKKLHGGFLFWALQSSVAHNYFATSALGITRYALSTNDVEQFPLLAPSWDKQERIANFLDEQTARIDALIPEKAHLLERLAELRQSTISKAVTVTEADSGWRKTRLKFLVRDIVDTEHKTVPFYDDGQYLVARTSNIKKGCLILDDAKYTDAAGYEEWTRRAVPAPGDILFTREAPAGEACLVPENIPLCLGQRTVLIRVRNDIAYSPFVLWSLYGGLSSRFISDLSQGSTVAHFNMPDIGNIPLFTGPLEEQLQRAEKLGRQLQQLDELVSHTQQHITRLREYRSSLISAVVTGQINVDNYTSGEPIQEAA